MLCWKIRDCWNYLVMSTSATITTRYLCKLPLILKSLCQLPSANIASVGSCFLESSIFSSSSDSTLVPGTVSVALIKSGGLVPQKEVSKTILWGDEHLEMFDWPDRTDIWLAFDSLLWPEWAELWLPILESLEVLPDMESRTMSEHCESFLVGTISSWFNGDAGRPFDFLLSFASWKSNSSVEDL